MSASGTITRRAFAGGALALGVGIAASPILEINALSAALIVLLGFFFVTVFVIIVIFQQ